MLMPPLHRSLSSLVLVTSFLVAASRGIAADAPAPLVVEGKVEVLEWAPPVYSEELSKAGVQGQVELALIVEADGSVSSPEVLKSPDPRLNPIALDTLKAWRFQPALEAGAPVASDIVLPIVFKLGQAHEGRLPLTPPKLPRARPVKKAAGKVMPVPDYPTELETVGVRGSVTLEVLVGSDGKVSKTRIRGASHPAFVTPSLECMERQWLFEPARQGRVPRSETVFVPMEYDFPLSSRKELLERVGISGEGGETLREGRHLPLLVGWYAPVYPFEALVSGKTGKAIVDIETDSSGAVVSATEVESSEPLFVAALRASVMNWRFDPVITDGKGVGSKLRVTHHFVPPAETDTNTPESRLLQQLKTAEGIPFLKKGTLDSPLRPLYRLTPLTPGKPSRNEKLRIDITAVIDREGRVRLPSFDASHHVEYGFAAAQAVQQWVFAPPVSHGNAVDVRVVIPFSFEI